MKAMFEDVIRYISENAMLKYLYDTSVTVSLMVVFLLLVRPLMKRMPRRGMYILWLVVIVRILCPISIHGIYHMIPEPIEHTVSETNQSIKIDSIASRLREPVEVQYGGVKNGYRLAPEEEAADLHTETKNKVVEKTEGVAAFNQSEREEPFFEGMGMDSWMLVIWGAGVFVLLFYMVISMLRTWRKFSDARLLFDNVYSHPLVENSFVIGLVSPKIYISERIVGQDMEYILCHERKHIKRKDHLVKPLMFVLTSLYWFNPFMWLAWHFMMKDMEVSCDEAVIRELGEGARETYSYLLVSLAAGRKKWFHQNAAFSVGVVKDRIKSIMKYKKPTTLTSAILILAVFLCSCSITSTPQETTPPVVTQKKEEGVYIERMFRMYQIEMPITGDFVSGNGQPDLNNQGEVVWISDMTVGEERRLCEFVLVDNRWEEKESAWLKEYDKMFQGKNVQMQYWYFADDGYLYLNIYASLEEGERGDYEKDCYMFLKIDEEKGTIDTIQIPSQREEGKDNGAAQLIYSFAVFSDGNILIPRFSEGIVNDYEIYSGATGEKVGEGKLEPGAFTEPYTGDGYFAYGIHNQQTGMVDIGVFNEETGEKEYTIETGVTYVPDSAESYGKNCAIGVRGTSIIMASTDGIFEAEYGEEELTRIVDSEKDNTYYLSEQKYTFLESVYKGDDSYLLYRYNNKSDELGDMICYYQKK